MEGFSTLAVILGVRGSKKMLVGNRGKCLYESTFKEIKPTDRKKFPSLSHSANLHL